MTKYMLHGGFTGADNELNHSFFREFGKDLKDGDKVLIVLFALTHSDYITSFNNLVQRCKNQMDDKSIEFILATESDFEAQLSNSNAVYIAGGNTPTLLSVLDNYTNLKEKFTHKTIAGSSAGAYALATLGAAHTTEHIRKGLAILPIRLICHFESPELPPTETSLKELQEADPGLELVKLKDCEWKVIEM